MPLPDPTLFLETLLSQLPDFRHLYLDHICYRTETREEYLRLKTALVTHNELLAETRIGGRPISTFRLQKPFVYKDRRIELLELPAPKDQRYPTGYDHVEFVTDRPLPEFLEHLTGIGIPAAAIDRSGINKARNADLRLKLAGHTSVKFHELPLDEVIRRERQIE